MKIFSSFSRRSFLLAAVPAALVFSSCGDDDDSPAVQQGRVLVSHAAASANVAVKALINNTEVGQLTYGQSSAYLNVNASPPTLIKINVAASNMEAASQPVTIAGNQNYSVFAYAPTATTVDLLTITDDLTAPASGQAKIRIVHLGLGAPSPVKLSQQTIAGATDVPGIGMGAAFAAATAFVTIPAATYNLLVTTGTSSTTVVAVGDGTGTGTGTKNYEAGKIYTVVVRGVTPNFDVNLLPKAVIIQNN